MSVILWWVLGVSLLTQGCLGSPGVTESGCSKWSIKGDNACCEICHPGNRVVKLCGPDPKALCTPCGPNTYTAEPKQYSCTRCTQCEGAQVLVTECTSTTDTVCGCKKGLRCGDKPCSFCIKECGKGEEPAEKRSCRKCPDGTFNDQIHQKCKPWRTRCPHPDELIVAKGNAVSDIECSPNISTPRINTVIKPVEPHAHTIWPVVITCVVLTCLGLITIYITKVMKIIKKSKKTKKTITQTPIIRTPTDDPRTLIAVECSFHEAQQEQGSSSESLASKDSKNQLIV
ncbi:tumor necrosis factor receptor superfamily member 9a [Centroberyx affinis]|uniref:tumor necrosis factor receptor superfamily member 9a n=1 Tax=Centroberyx affinis TaxID=166261 RepID=UPI003A5BE440